MNQYETSISRSVFATLRTLHDATAARLAVRDRLKRYTYGDQWADPVRDVDGKVCPESDVLIRTGRRPVTNNLIRRLIKTIVGRYRNMAATEGFYDSAPLAGMDSVDELDSRLLEEFLISGMAIQRVADDNPLLGRRPWVENVPPTHFVVNDFRDPRGADIEFAAMLHDMSPAEARLRFGSHGARLDGLLRTPPDAADTFGTPAVAGRVRLAEVWTREYTPSGRLLWRCRWYTAAGAQLATYVSPWAHASHPFAVKFYPLTDGEVHSFVEDIVDQQRYINRLVVLIDRILATSAKGVLLFPMHQKVEGIEWEDIARRWSATDGIIPIRGNCAELPQQIHAGGGDVGAHRLLELELKLFEEVSGVSSALAGTADGTAGGVRGADLYKAQVENATIALTDTFSTFRHLLDVRNVKLANLRKPCRA